MEPARFQGRTAGWMASIAREKYGGPPDGQYAYVPHHESKPYFDMAHEWVLADQMFASQLDESFVAHQYIIAAQAGSSVDVPDFYWGCPGGQNDSVATITHRRTYGRGRSGPVLITKPSATN